MGTKADRRTRTSNRRAHQTPAIEGGAGRLTAAMKARIARATVHLPKRGGQGVLVPGGFVLTAAHCLSWDDPGGMVLDASRYSELVETRGGERFMLTPVAREAIADIAVLGCPDDEKFPDLVEAFETWCEATPPISIRTTTLEVREPYRIHVLTHLKTWVRGTATRVGGPNVSAYRDAQSDLAAV